MGRRVQEMVACIQKYILIYFPGDSFRSTPKQVYTINKHTFINTKDGRTQSATDIRRTRHIIETARHRLTVHRSHGPYSTDRFRRNIQYTKHRFRRNTLTKHRFRRNTLTKHRFRRNTLTKHRFRRNLFTAPVSIHTARHNYTSPHSK